MTAASGQEGPVASARVAIITGAEGGIGAATARRIAADGYRLVLVGPDRARLLLLADEIGAIPVAGDASDPALMATVVRTAVREHGGLDTLIACAGVSGGAALLETDDDGWSRTLRINLDTAFVSARAALPALIDSGGGSVVVTASLASVQAPPQNVAYTTSKHALLGLVRSIARDYGPRGIRANAVCPGWTRTAMADELMETIGGLAGIDREQAWELAVSDLPLGRAATPAEVANVIAFLAGDQSAMVSGQAIVVDGGASAVDVPSVALMRAVRRGA